MGGRIQGGGIVIHLGAAVLLSDRQLHARPPDTMRMKRDREPPPPRAAANFTPDTMRMKHDREPPPRVHT